MRLERCGVAFGLLPASQLQGHIDRIPIEPGLVVADAALADDGFAFGQRVAPGARSVERAGKRAERARTFEAEPGIATTCQGVADQRQRLVRAALRKRCLGQKFKRDCSNRQAPSLLTRVPAA
jgi:hypothetical protein